jgi:DNA-binding NtrC family response regulator
VPLSIDEAAGSPGFDPAVARRSPAMATLLDTLAALARDGRRVLFHGPSGAGKECMARFYAGEAARSGHIAGGMRFVAVNCACLGTLAQSELFGHVEGAATDVRRSRPGAFELAAGGILFLDEVGDIPAAAQPLLLRALDPTSGSARRVGASEDYTTTSVTVVAATNRPLDALREDLRARLGHVITVPGLDERDAEIAPVLRAFMERALSERRDITGSWLAGEGALPRIAARISERIAELARRQSWPGNFRDLRTCVEFAASVAPLIDDDDHPEPRFVARVSEAFCRRAGGSPADLTAVVEHEPSPVDDTEARILELLIEALRGVAIDQHRALAHLVASSDAFTRADVEAATGLKNRTALKRIQLLKERGLVADVDGGRYRVVTPREPALPTPVEALRPPVVTADSMGGEVDELRTLLARTRGVVLVGSPGSGKTRLAAQVARTCAAGRPVLWFSLASGNVEQLLDAVEAELEARGIDCGDNRDADAPGRAIHLTGFVATALADALLVIDDADRAVDPGDVDTLAVIARHWTRTQLLLCGRYAPPREVSEGMVEHPPWAGAAERIHHYYQRFWERRGQASGLPARFDELSEELKRSNYQMARSIPAALAGLSIDLCRIEPWATPRTPDISDDEIAALARDEHQRWRQERESAGYVHGPERDEAARTNPHLVAWDELPESARQLTRESVRQWPVILAAMGYELRRRDASADLDDPELIERLARVLHEQYVAERTAEGDTISSNPALVDYDALPEELKEANRDSARTLPRKLDVLGLRLQPDSSEDAPPLRLSDEQIEALSVWEHNRWCWHKRLQGFLPADGGEGDERTSADLVPWSSLSEAIRDRDREKVAAIPDLLARAGSCAVAGGSAQASRKAR